MRLINLCMMIRLAYKLLLTVLLYSVFCVHHSFFSAHFCTFAHLYSLCSAVFCNTLPTLMDECLFLAACHDYVLCVYLLLHLFVWQNKISSFFFFFFFLVSGDKKWSETYFRLTVATSVVWAEATSVERCWHQTALRTLQQTDWDWTQAPQPHAESPQVSQLQLLTSLTTIIIFRCHLLDDVFINTYSQSQNGQK